MRVKKLVYLIPLFILLSSISTPASLSEDEGGIQSPEISSINDIMSFGDYVNGSTTDYVVDVEYDSSGMMWVYGHTYSSDFELLNSSQTYHAGMSDVFVRQYYPNKTLARSMLFGGESLEFAVDLEIDSQGNFVLSGYTNSSYLPTLNAFQSTLHADYLRQDDAFLAKFAYNGTLLFSTYFGGWNIEDAGDIAIDSHDNIILIGTTNSGSISIFPTKNAYQENHGGWDDMYIAKFSPTGSLNWSTYLGGSDWDYGKQVVIGANDSVFFSGYTGSTNFPVVNGFQSRNSNYEGVVGELNATGSLVWASYLGGSEYEYVYAMDIDSKNNLVLTGHTKSTDYPVLNAAFPTHNDAYLRFSEVDESFVTKLNSSGLIWSTYLGGNYYDAGLDIAVDQEDGVYVTGTTTSTNLTLSGDFTSYQGGNDGFLTRFTSNGTFDMGMYLGGTDDDYMQSIDISSTGLVAIGGYTYSFDFPVTTATTKSGSYDGTITEIINPKIDNDGDGLTDILEDSIGTDPFNSDTDGDTMPDDYEYIHNLDPLDASDYDLDYDEDGLSNGEEFALGTNPTKADSDGDSMPDKFEYDLGLDPTNKTDGKDDYDSDTLPNSWEYRVGLDLTNSSDASLDNDEDTLNNTIEYSIGTHPFKNDSDGDTLSDNEEYYNYTTDPTKKDTDADGIDDNKELFEYDTDALNPDTDEDGLLDGEEIEIGTDPLEPDTDGDGYTDSEEVEAGSDPTDAESIPQDDDESDDEITDPNTSSDADEDPSLLSFPIVMLGLIPLIVLLRRNRIDFE